MGYRIKASKGLVFCKYNEQLTRTKAKWFTLIAQTYAINLHIKPVATHLEHVPRGTSR